MDLARPCGVGPRHPDAEPVSTATAAARFRSGMPNPRSAGALLRMGLKPGYSSRRHHANRYELRRSIGARHMRA